MPKKYKLHSGTFTIERDAFDGLLLMPDAKYPTPATDHIIWLAPHLTGRRLLDTLIHELLHEEHPGMSEEDVTRTATNIASVLWGEGYRREPK